MAESFQTALKERALAMADACTRCGKCVEACPITPVAGVHGEPSAVIGGVLDIVRTGTGPEPSRRWAASCVQSGECIKACDYGVNPRFLLAMARVSMAQAATDASEQRRKGIENFRAVSRDVLHISKMQLAPETLARLGQGAQPQVAARKEPPDFVFYTGCNVLRTPHIALLCLDIMDRLGITYEVMGGPTHCCGVVQLRTGDTETSGRVAQNSLDKLAASKTGKVISWCPSCYVQFTETTLPTVEKMRGARPFEMTPFILFLHSQIERLRPHLRERVPLRVGLYKQGGIAGVVEAAEALLTAVPGIELVDLGLPRSGLQSTSLGALPAYRRDLQARTLAAARAAGVDALVAVYHTDHRDLCAHERDQPFRIMNILEIVGASMGLQEEDQFKRLKKLGEVDAILNDCRDMIAAHRLNPETARVAVEGMLAEQPVPVGCAAG